MKLQQLHPELRSTYRFIPNAPISSRLGRALVRFATGRLTPPVIPPGVRLEKITLADTPELHVFSPESGGTDAALLYVHGGGMVIGTPLQDYPMAISLVQELQITVVLAGYRLAPEHPFPAPLDDCTTAWEWLLKQAPHRDIDTTRLAIGGQSAGGGLAAMLVQRIHQQGGTQPVAQWLFCPMLDDRTAADRSRDKMNNRLWNNRANRAGWKALLGVEPGSASVPPGSVPARQSNLTGLPATWIGTGTVELFYDEDVAYGSALTAAGVTTTIDQVPGAPHAFETIAGTTGVARDYNARARRWLAEQLAADAQPRTAG